MTLKVKIKVATKSLCADLKKRLKALLKENKILHNCCLTELKYSAKYKSRIHLYPLSSL